MMKCENVAVDIMGNIVPGTSVTVYLAGTLTPASIYSDDLLTFQANPFTVASDASYFFYAANGRYDAVLVKMGYTFNPTQTSDILLFDNSGAIVTDLPAYTVASGPTQLPAAGVAGRLARVKDDVRGIWIDTGTLWRSVTGYADALDFGGGYTQATLVAALTAIGTSTKTKLFLSAGTWVISSSVDWSAYTNVTFVFAPGAVLSHGAFTVNIPNVYAANYSWNSGAGAVTISGSPGAMLGVPVSLGAAEDATSVAIGLSALAVSSGAGNTAIGAHAAEATTSGTTVTAVGKSALSNNITFSNSLGLGYNAQVMASNQAQLGDYNVTVFGFGPNKITWSAAAPSTGTWTQGDRAFNATAASGQPKGWVCTVSGTFSAATEGGTATSGSPILTAMADTSDFFIGQYVDASAMFAVLTALRILQVTATTITVSRNANASGAATLSTTDPTWVAESNL